MPRKVKSKRIRQGDKAKAAGKFKPTAKPEDADSVDELVEALNAPREWPPPTVATELKAMAEKQQPGFTEKTEKELRRRRMVPLPTLIRQNNENSYTPGDPEELESVLEMSGFYTPAYLRMEMEYDRSRPQELPEAHRRKVCAQQHDRALRMREVDPSLPPVPAFTDDPVRDEKNLRQWCTDAEVRVEPAKAHALPRPEDVKADSTKQAVAPDTSQITVSTNEFDAFLCHASEDKQAIVEPFAATMEHAGLKPWIDEGQVTWGDVLIHRIQNGLVRSRFVVVFVSAAFLGKGWPEKELETALSMEMGGRKVVLPILLGLTHAEVERRYPMVSCKKYKEVPEYAPGKRVSKKIIAAMVDELKAFIS